MYYNTRTLPDREPTAIAHVFANSKKVIAGGRVEADTLAGKVL